ncbi:SRPBCC family protein [bacterium]|nr:SRPBCC family protein [bacterium]
MLNVQTEIIINRSIEDVAAYAADPDHTPEWYVNIKSVEWKTPKPLVIGSQVNFTSYFLGRKLVYTYEFVEFVPNQKLVMRTAEGPFPMETTYTWIALDTARTKMILQNKGTPGGFSKLFAPFMGILVRRANNNDLKRLKKNLETK